VKHGYATSLRDWPHSSFHRWVEKGVYDINWGHGLEQSHRHLRLMQAGE